VAVTLNTQSQLLFVFNRGRNQWYFGAEKQDDVYSFVRKIRAKIMWNILFESRFDFISSHNQYAYSKRIKFKFSL